MSLARVFPVFSVAFAVLYVLSMDNNWALFTYLARAGEFHPLVYAPPTPRAGPAMYWWGWLATSGIGAAIVAGIAAALPAGWAGRHWTSLSWLVPLAMLLVLVFLLRGWFIRTA
ncbi:MAG: hypothetical protein JO128_24110 [Alphaproteobacteria bacterium]|nr:hypothetical protein [Alphaproteobacteria bacterium]